MGNNPATMSATSFKYLVTYCGGVGPDVWDAEKEISAVNISDALDQVGGGIEDAGGWITSIQQNDHPEPVQKATAKDDEAIERIDRVIFEMPTNHPLCIDWARVRMLLTRQSRMITEQGAMITNLSERVYPVR